MKYFTIILGSIFSISISYSQDFQNSIFGTNVENVKNREGTPTNEFTSKDDGSTWLIYKEMIEGIPCNVIFIFYNDRLTKGAYDLTNGETLNKISLQQFKQIEEFLIDKFGAPSISIDFAASNDEKFKEVQIASEWRELDRFNISHQLLTDNFHLVEFSVK